VLSDYEFTTYRIYDVSLSISNPAMEKMSRSTEVGCGHDQVIFFFQHVGENTTILVEFKVSGLIMGPNAGRANLFLDEVQVATCAHEICTAVIPLERYQECRSSTPLESSSCTDSHELSIRLFAMEPTLQFEEMFFLGVSHTFSFIAAPASARSSDSVVRILREDERVSPDLCISSGSGALESEQAQAARPGDTDAAASRGAAEQREAGAEPERVAEEGESSSSQQAFMWHLVQAHPQITEVRNVVLRSAGG
jgi:hypothetical protein